MPAAEQLRFRILGTIEVWRDGKRLEVEGRKQQALLALLLLNVGRPMSPERLMDELWGERPPAAARKNLHVHLSRLRATLGNGVLIRGDAGYELDVDRENVDLQRFEELADEARRLLAAGRYEKASRRLREGLALWRGAPLAGLEDEPFVAEAGGRLDELRLAALEDRVDADLARGDGRGLVVELEALVREQPFRERLHGQLMLALYRQGRQADALALYRRTRADFADQLGLEPGPALQELERSILVHDPALRPQPPSGVARRLRPVLLAGAAIAALAAAGIFASVRAGDSASSNPALPVLVANSVAKIDPRTNEIVQVTGVGRKPDAVAVGAGAVWVVNWQDRTVSRIDGSGAVETIGGVLRADHLAVDGDNVWVSSFDRSSVARINARTGEVVESLGVLSRHAEGLAVGGGYLWITNPATHRGEGIETVARVDLRSGKVDSRIPVGRTPIFDTFGNGALWVANYDDDTVSVVSPGSRGAHTIALGGACGPLGITTGFGAVWVVCYWKHQLVRIDTRTRRIVSRIPIGIGPLGVSAGAGAVWVTSRDSRTVTRIDPRSNTVVATVRLPAPLSPFGIAARNGGVWVSVRRCAHAPCL